MPVGDVSRTMGLLDVACALVLLATGIYIVSLKAPASPATNSRAVAWYRASGSVPLLLVVIFFVAESRVRWPSFWWALPGEPGCSGTRCPQRWRC
jgi:hypothetical protein